MNYLDIMQSNFYNETYSEIEILKKDFPVNHGFVHINNVIRYAKDLSKVFCLTKNQKELLLIACTLHDIGYLKGRENHAENGSIMAKEYLKNYNLNNEEVNIICNAIKNHGGKKQENFREPVSRCLALADKLDFSKDRYKNDISEYPEIKPYLNILKTGLFMNKKSFILQIIVNKEFSVKSLKDDYFNIKLENMMRLLSEELLMNYKIEYVVEAEPLKTIICDKM